MFSCLISKDRRSNNSLGFTIVELLVVIVVIGVLATITVISYTGISSKAKEAAVIADLDNTNKQFKLFQIENSGYPTTIDCTQSNSTTNKCIKISSDNIFGSFYSDNTTNPQTFCLTIKNGANIKKNINQDGIIADGACSFAFAGTMTATAVSRNQINLSWSAVTSATSYEIQKDTSSSFSSPTTIYTGSSTSNSSANLTQNTTYYYRVRATVNGDISNWSAAANATTPDFPAPATFAMNSKTTSSIGLTWATVSGASGYTLQRSSSASFTSTTDYDIVAPTSVKSITGLTAGGYYYRVRAYDAIGTSNWSTVIASFDYIGSPYTLTVPSGVSSVTIEAWGAQGGGNGGNGGYTKGSLSVTSGSPLYIYVGGAGSNTPDGDTPGAGGYNGGGTGGVGGWAEWTTYAGGGGGGASDVRYSGNTITPTDYRKVVAGGGGGGGGYDTNVALQVLGGYGGGASGGTGAQGYNGGGAGGIGGAAASGYSKGDGQTCTINAEGGGGGGYYGGSCGGFTAGKGGGGGGGGSGWIGGGAATITLTAGNASIPTAAGGIQTGNVGNGYIRITY
jgi:prepilin-type N-terminal cleavage/methylation domain-containing protein